MAKGVAQAVARRAAGRLPELMSVKAASLEAHAELAEDHAVEAKDATTVSTARADKEASVEAELARVNAARMAEVAMVLEVWV